MLFRKNHLKAYFTHTWKTKIKIRDSWLQAVSNGCQIDSLIPNARVNDIVINPFLKEASKTLS